MQLAELMFSTYLISIRLSSLDIYLPTYFLSIYYKSRSRESGYHGETDSYSVPLVRFALYYYIHRYIMVLQIRASRFLFFDDGGNLQSAPSFLGIKSSECGTKKTNLIKTTRWLPSAPICDTESSN